MSHHAFHYHRRTCFLNTLSFIIMADLLSQDLLYLDSLSQACFSNPFFTTSDCHWAQQLLSTSEPCQKCCLQLLLLHWYLSILIWLSIFIIQLFWQKPNAVHSATKKPVSVRWLFTCSTTFSFLKEITNIMVLVVIRSVSPGQAISVIIQLPILWQCSNAYKSSSYFQVIQ